jgi:NAD(P)-dependent dehydrogenase (short-subunit alcohol dehydrogenase family)
MDFVNKKVLITGGSRGIGQATALAFAEKGASVAVNFRTDKDAATHTVTSLPGEGHFAIRADVSQPDAVRQLIDTCINEMDGLDILVNNAGVYLTHPLASASYEQWQQAWQDTLSTNLLGPANLCYCAAQYMIENGGGRIINVSSRGAFRGEPQHTAYGASKAGLNALGQSLAQELAPYGVFVGTVAPGFVSTDMAQAILESEAGEEIRQQSPLQRVATPDEIAHAILFLASEKAAFTTGCILDVNGASYLRS